MALTQRLELKQGQSLVMTPQLQQAIKLLQLSNLELTEYVEGELERNPLLEREEAQAPEAETSPSESHDDADAPLVETLAREDFGTAADLDAGHDDLYTDESRAEKTEPGGNGNSPPLTDWSRAGSNARPDGDDDFEGNLAAETTLKNHLEGQLAIAALPPAQRFIAIVLIESVDEAGYLRADLAEVAERLGCTVKDCEDTLAELQGFDPAGVFARDLPECLALQLKEQDRLDPAMKALLTRLDLVAKRDLAGLSELCRLELADISEMIAEVRKLNPKPGLAFGSEPVQPVVPDVYVRENADGTWHIELNSDTLPRVLVNSRYYAEVNRTARTREDKLCSYIFERSRGRGPAFMLLRTEEQFVDGDLAGATRNVRVYQ